MRELTKNDARFHYYGRTVGVVTPDAAPLEVLVALARLQGNASYQDMADSEVTDLRATFDAMGLSTVHYARWETGENALTVAHKAAHTIPLPAGYTLAYLTPDTPADLRGKLADTALECGVLPPSLAVLSGAEQPGVCAMALDQAGDVAACAAAASVLPPAHPDAQITCWWGMLATAPAHRGKALSLHLGAKVMIAMHETYGFERFFTGVVPGNAASEAVCRKLGLAHRGRSILGVADPGLVPGGRMTK